jgi:spermidine/putrescine transport system permease protein
MNEGSDIRRPNRALTLHAALVLIVLYLPILLIPLFSFNTSIYVRFPIEGFSLAWYRDLFNRPDVWQALGNSLRVGVAVAVLATALGVLTARAIARYRVPGRSALVTFVMLPLVVPGIIFGVALAIFVNRLGVPLSLYTVALGHLVICLPFAVATLLPRFEGFDEALIEASAVLGETPWMTFWRVTLPNVLPGVVASLLLTFTVAFDEFIVALFLSWTEQTLPIHIWTRLRFPRPLPSVLALSSLILLFSVAMACAALLIAWIGAPAGHGTAEGR